MEDIKKKEVLITENVFLKMEFRGAESRLLPHRTAYKWQQDLRSKIHNSPQEKIKPLKEGTRSSQAFLKSYSQIPNSSL